MPPGLPDLLLANITTNDWLPAQCFDDSNDQWCALALPTLMTWIQSDNQFHHGPSSTWRGRPNGEWWIVAALACCATTFSLIEHNDDVPDTIQEHFSPNKHTQNWTQHGRIATLLIKCLEESNATLRWTFNERAKTWMVAVIKVDLRDRLTLSDEQL